MNRCTSRLLNCSLGKAIAYAGYAAVLLGAVLGLWLMAERDYQARLEHLQREFGDVNDRISALVASSTDHVDILRSHAEALLAAPATSDATRRLFDALKPSSGFTGYALDQVSEDLDLGRISNLTGSGEIPPAESGAGREMLVALALNPLFEATRRQLPEAAWVYYTSKNRFMAIQPWVTSRDFHWSEDLPGYDFYKLGLPDRNPTRTVFWTDVYLDAAGKGLMATVGAPVYDQVGRFRGTIDLDLTLGTLSRIMEMGDFGGARVLLANAQNHVIADSAANGAPPQALTDLAAALPALHDAALEPPAAPDALRRYGGWLLDAVPVEGAPWRLLMTVDRGGLLAEVARSIWIGLVGILLLAVALVAVELRRRAGRALAEKVVALRKVTGDLKRANDEARRANSAKSMLLANVSHELRTPLNAIIGFSEVMRLGIYGPLGDPKYEDYARDINDSGQMLLSLINDLLDVTKLEEGRHALLESDCDAAAIIEQTAALLQGQAEAAGVALAVKVASRMPRLRGDERALRQIVANLLSNAIKFTPRGGAVTVSCGLDAAGRPVIAVKDTGRGIPAAELKDLFRPFARTAEARRSSTPGTGLGLAIVKALVELHQGEIGIESEVGRGTAVTVTLPAARALAARAAA